ncbi:MAG: 23S rRNA (uridine(2552)-2'-O)-methyltransferase [Haloarculaceae archaeon]
MTGRDKYYNKAKQQGYRARSAYKLQQLDETADLLGQGRTVVDLGAAPGGWLQVAAERVGPEGLVVGVDRQRIDPLEDRGEAVPVLTVRGDVTEASTVATIREAVSQETDDEGAGDVGDGELGEGDVDGGDSGGGQAGRDGSGQVTGGPVHVVLSDMAPNVSGEYDLDHARSVHLARQALEIALEVLRPGGDLAVKVFDGRDLDDLQADIESEFQYVRQVRPEASRDESSELYLVAKGRLTGPVSEDDVLEVEIVDEGDQGDGIARPEGYTLFVSGVSVGETVRVRVEDVTPTYGFAQPVED